VGAHSVLPQVGIAIGVISPYGRFRGHSIPISVNPIRIGSREQVEPLELGDVDGNPKPSYMLFQAMEFARTAPSVGLMTPTEAMVLR
jgi:hypothetical protein